MLITIYIDFVIIIILIMLNLFKIFDNNFHLLFL